MPFCMLYSSENSLTWVFACGIKKKIDHVVYCFVLCCCVNICDFNYNKIKENQTILSIVLTFAVNIIKAILLWVEIIVKSLIHSNKYWRKESSSERFSLILDKICLLKHLLQSRWNKYVFPVQWQLYWSYIFL